MNFLFKYRIWWHVLFWVVWYFFYIFTYSSGVIEQVQFINNLGLLPVRMAYTYLLIYWILPNFLLKKRHLLFALLLVLHGILFGFSVWIVLNLVTGKPYFEPLPFIRPLVLNYQIPATAATIYMFKRWYLIREYSLSLEKEKIESELNFLKSQIHPHFLFNTLNNLYALTLQKSEKAPDMVLRLSNLLEYTLYSGKESEVELSEEMTQIRGYIDLEKLRFGNRLKITAEMDENVRGLTIAPVLLLPFVENSFKHGASSDVRSPYIQIQLAVNGNVLDFRVINSYQPESGKFEKYRERIGLKNVRRRLELLYPMRHQLDIIQTENTFEVKLHIELNSSGILTREI
jgi:two-component system, LytTR family, sensor kinase